MKICQRKNINFWGRGNNKYISEEEKSERQCKLDYARHVHGIGFLIARIVFKELADVKTLIISAYTQRILSQTGKQHDDYIYSVKTNRDMWDLLNFDKIDFIDPVEVFEMSDLSLNMIKTEILKTIKPIENV